MNDVDLAEVLNSIQKLNDEVEFDMIMFCSSNGYGLKGGLITTDDVDINNRKDDLRDMIGYMLRNAEITKEDIIQSKRIKSEIKSMLNMIIEIEEMDN